MSNTRLEKHKLKCKVLKESETKIESNTPLHNNGGRTKGNSKYSPMDLRDMWQHDTKPMFFH